MAEVTQLMGILLGMSNFEFDKEKNERARQLYQTYIADYISNLKFGKDVLEPGKSLVTHIHICMHKLDN